MLANSNSSEIIIDPSLIDNRWYLDRSPKHEPFHSFSIPRTAEAVDDKFKKLLFNIEAEYAHCPDDQQKLNFIDSISKAVNNFQAISIEDISVVKSVTPKGRPRATIGSRIPSKHEQQAPSHGITSSEPSETKGIRRKRKNGEASNSADTSPKGNSDLEDIKLDHQ
ncbi:hypothetical protein BJV82DRAFT_663472 [Fennellomyces sp. T-0311]|nr:hypothetical protein BJV82DRAFT_663472 [Fennellomyces sp. T-0311]